MSDSHIFSFSSPFPLVSVAVRGLLVVYIVGGLCGCVIVERPVHNVSVWRGRTAQQLYRHWGPPDCVTDVGYNGSKVYVYTERFYHPRGYPYHDYESITYNFYVSRYGKIYWTYVEYPPYFHPGYEGRWWWNRRYK